MSGQTQQEVKSWSLRREVGNTMGPLKLSARSGL